MNTIPSSNRAEATVWMPLLSILGGIAQRVARRRAEEQATEKPVAAGDEPPARGEAA
jgi:hypothetical protein